MDNAPGVKKSFSLGAKLVLSYLGVALGAIVLIVVVVTLAVHNYFYQSQISQLQENADSASAILATYYQQAHDTWDHAQVPPDLRGYSEIMDIHGTLYIPSYLYTFPADSNTKMLFKQALQNALQGQDGEGSFQSTATDGNGDISTISGIYAAAPIRLNNQIIGAVLLVQPDRYPQNLASDFLTNVNTTILVAGLGVAILVVLFSLYMTRRLTKPLISLTHAAEAMKAGNYMQRAEPPGSQDELGILALTFNAMADKIAADVHTLRIQEQLRRDLIANIAHDLVTPLTAIQGYSEAIADNVISEPTERQETAQLIGREVQRLRRLVSDMQNMTALEAGRVTLELAPLDMHDLVAETLAVIAPECEQAQIRLCNEIQPETPLALADSDRIAQVLLNLLDNARRHTPARGQITIGARSDGRALIVWVKDTGVGIHPEDLPYIFERFYRVDRSRNGSSGGSGLGLAIIKAIIAGHGGSTWAESTIGQGTTIFFSLPLVQTSVATAQTRPAIPPGTPVLPRTRP